MAITNEATIRVKIDGKDAEISVKDMGKAIETAMKRGKAEADKLKTSFTRIGDMAQRFYFSFQSLRIFVHGAMNFVDAANRQEVAVAGMEQAFRSMGRYTEEFSGKIRALASQIQSEGIIGDEAILEGTKFLATYKDISDETLPRAMKVMTDIAALMGGDVRNAANMVGKASMGMVGELRRAGITISEATMKSKDFNDILREIEEQVGGQNKALAATSAGGMKQFANAWGDLKEQIGTVLKNFMIPFVEMLKPLVQWITKIDTSMLAMAGTLGITGIALAKLIPILKGLGIASKAALGWIGIIITAVTLLYTAWTTNFLGIRDALKGFWEFLKNWAKNIGTTLSALGKLIVGVLTFSGSKIKEGWNELRNSFVSTWKEAFAKVKQEGEKKIVPAKTVIEPAFEDAGKAAGEAFSRGFDKGMDLKGLTKFKLKEWTEFILSRDKKPRLMGEVAEAEEKRLESLQQVTIDFMNSLDEMGLRARNIFNTIVNAMYQLSDRIVDAMFNAKTKFKDLWIGITKDFTRLFVDEILKVIAKKLVVQMISLLAIFDKASNDRLAVRIGRDYARFFTQGVFEGLNPQALAVSMAGVGSMRFNDGNIIKAINNTNSRLQNIESRLGGNGSPNVIVKIGGKQLYEGVKQGREAELIRRGKEVNQNLF